ncbi:MAG: aldo/keto reductase [Eubacteriales bacterium]|nr:aldo/keto reductase [Eubacteriales bacterium]
MLRRTTFLNTDREMPLLGLGVYKATAPGEVEQAIQWAVQAGYRLIDTASVYKNEDGVGRGIASCSIPRSELFITTKVWNTAQRLADVRGAFERSLDRLGLDYVDLYLIHWPVPGCYLNTWSILEELYHSGRARSIGVSNFEIRHLEELAKYSDIVPAVNQIEVHPLRYPKELVEYCQERGIQVQAYAPLARGAYLDDDIMCVLATKYAKTPAQIGLRWALQKGIAVIPKSTKEQRILANGDLFSFEIQEEDMAIIDTMNQNFRSSSIPEDLRDIPF